MRSIIVTLSVTFFAIIGTVAAQGELTPDAVQVEDVAQIAPVTADAPAIPSPPVVTTPDTTTHTIPDTDPTDKPIKATGSDHWTILEVDHDHPGSVILIVNGYSYEPATEETGIATFELDQLPKEWHLEAAE